jgi:hypothetical protein
MVLLALLAACSLPRPASDSATQTRPTVAPTPVDPGILGANDSAALRAKIPALATRDEDVAAALEKRIPIIKLRDTLSDEQQLAQELAIADPRFFQYARDPRSGAPLRSEIFGVYPTRASDLTPATAACNTTKCFRVELYNYALNLTTLAIVDPARREVLDVGYQSDAQPDIPQHLADLATQIAVNSPEVIAALGSSPSPNQAVMPNVKTSLNDSKCERSKHLCVAPTFLVGDRALWAIVDLTDGRLVGVRWTDLGAYNGPRVTEKQLQNDVVMRGYCDHETALTQDGWSLKYMLTSSDGLRISDVVFNGTPVLRNAKLVDWHVTYSQRQGFGYSDAVGCPVFSQSAVIAIGPPKIAPIAQDGQPLGFTLTQDYWSEYWPQPCNYNYQQTYEFYRDGRFRVKTASLGRGCGNDGMYRPVFRIAFAGTGSFAQWSGDTWQTWQQEQWALERDLKATPEGYQFRYSGQAGGGYMVEPGRGQFGDGGRGDNAYVYITRNQAGRDEGEADMITIGPCCNEDYHQGPEKFIEPQPEPIENAELVLWYVPQMKNDDTPGKEYCWANSVLEGGVYATKVYPCFAGPMFVPIR